MSFIARIKRVEYGAVSGMVLLHLEQIGPSFDRLLTPLVVINPPPERQLDVMLGMEIWGNASWVHIGLKKWAERVGYYSIRLYEAPVPA